jgi:predicted transcriptional regulator of viral defense system
VTFRSLQFKGVGFPKALSLKDRETFDVVRTDRAGLEVRVTGLERTFVDVLNRPDLTGSWEEIWRSLESVEFFDLDKVALYVDLLGNATTAAKVGFFLEQHRDSLMVDEAHLKTFRDRRPRRPHYLERSRRKAGRFVAAWNLVVPEEVYGRSWEELR